MTTLKEIVNKARSLDRFLFDDFRNNVFDEFVELHGDRNGHDDSTITVGLAKIDKKKVAIAFIRKGATINENKKFNFGSPRPYGYKKVARVVKLAEKFKIPIITIVNTSGAAASLQDEYDGQSTAIAELIKIFGGLKVPTISIFTGEGESGGALALANTDKIIMLENSIFSIASPEAFSSILFKERNEIQWEELNKLPMKALDLLALGICEEVINEEGYSTTEAYINIKKSIERHLNELEQISADDRVFNRQKKLDELTKQ
jgi:acetyl-CoA carboxylase carboxyl transferase alpha subunit